MADTMLHPSRSFKRPLTSIPLAEWLPFMPPVLAMIAG
jgi:hypothetical protein